MKNKLYIETANAFKGKIETFDRESPWLYTFEVKGYLDRLEASLTRLYENNCLSLSDFKRFDSMLFTRRANVFE